MKVLPSLSIDYVVFTLSITARWLAMTVTISTIRGYEDRWYRRIDSGRNLEYSHWYGVSTSSLELGQETTSEK